MNNKRKVGLLIAYKNPNYGTMLQAYATQYVVDSLGFETEIIDYYPDRYVKHYAWDWGLLTFLFDAYHDKKKKEERTKCADFLFQENASKRKASFQEFVTTKLHGIEKINGFSNLKRKGAEYDAILIGSDQKWHPGFSFGVDSSFRFVPTNVRTISYATSLGVSEYPKSYWNTSRKVWNRINFLSVREKTGAEIIKQICGKDTHVEVVVDPTYLISKEKWQELIPVERNCEERYLFCYFLGNDEASKMCARRYADCKGLKLVSVVSNESFSEIDQKYADYLVVGEGPASFVNWIRGAECIFTDSFHGTAFSVINEKQVYIFYRKNDSVKLQRHSRIDDITTLWGISDRLIHEKERDWENFCEKSIDYSYVTPLLIQERQKSLDFLIEALTF